MAKFAVLRAALRAGLPKDRKYRWKRSRHCYWCNNPCRFHGRFVKPSTATREHIVPRSLGGGGGVNIATACARCNNARSSDTTWVRWHDLPRTVRRQGVPMRLIGDEYLPALKAVPA